MGFLNRLILFLFSILALIVGIVGWGVFIGFVESEFLNEQLGSVGWIALGILWMIGAFRLFVMSFTSFSKKVQPSDERLIAKGNSGEMVLTPEVIFTMVSHELEDIKGIHDVEISPYLQKGKMEITLNLKADVDQNLPELIKMIQKRVSEKLHTQTGIKPAAVIVEINEILPKSAEVVVEEEQASEPVQVEVEAEESK